MRDAALVQLGEGVYRMEAGTDYFGRTETSVSFSDAFKLNDSHDVRELFLSEQYTAIDDGALYFKNLERLHLSSAIRRLGHDIFKYCSPARRYIEIVFEGTSEQFAQLGAPCREQVRIEEAGRYDHQPYCFTEGTGYRYEEQERRFDQSIADCRVICADGKTLLYGYKTREK